MADQIHKQWRFAGVDRELYESMSRTLGISPVLGRILVNRGIDTVESARMYLQPQLAQLHDPSLLPDMTSAAERIVQAVQGGERIIIYGDYDVDGVTATALLIQCLRMAGANVSYYIPERLDEGYGLNVDAIRQLKDDGASLIITVDCGIGAYEEAAIAQELGITLIITDHHEPGPESPPAYAVIDPKLPASDYPFNDLSGAGVAFKLAWGIAQSFSGGKKVSEEFREFLLNAVVLAALGTIADVVPLRGENRVLAKFGLAAMEETKSPGIRALIEVAGIDQQRLTATHVAFGLAPRLNAAGRLGSARRGVELLITDSYGQAAEIAGELDRCNRDRQEIERGILQAAQDRIETEMDLDHTRVILLADADWHLGVIGIVASKIAEKYYRPTIMLSIDGDAARGSARSIPPFHLYNALDACREHIISFGGHAQAAGLQVRIDQIDALRNALNQHASQVLDDQDLMPALTIDSEVMLAAVNEGLATELERLMPYGHGNPKPVLAADGVTIGGQPRRVGRDGQHLSFYARQGGVSFRTIAFGMGELADELEAHKDGWAVAFIPKINEWGGRRSVELEIRDIHRPD